MVSMEDTEEREPRSAFTAELVSLGDCGPPVARYKDKKGNDVSPIPLHMLDDEDQEQLDAADSRKRFPPRQHPVMRTFLHVTTALYSMAGLGSKIRQIIRRINADLLSSFDGKDFVIGLREDKGGGRDRGQLP